jgi:5-methylcytosine-specific restriction enzyme subunit McrC
MAKIIQLAEFEDTYKPTKKRPEPKSYIFKEIDRKFLQTSLKNIVTINNPDKRDEYFLKASHYVGSTLLPSGDYIIRIQPKINGPNLFYMLMKCGLFPTITFENIEAQEGKTLVDLLAGVFIEYVKKIIGTGLYRTYITIVEETPTIKGRLLLAKNIRSPLSIKLKPWCEYDELSFDVIENRCILYCADLLLRAVIDDDNKQELVTIRNLFLNQNVTLTPINSYELDTIHIQKFNKNYENALKICEYILRRKYYHEFSKSGIDIPGFFFPMHILFQEFVHITLKESLGPEFNVVYQNKNPNIIEQIEDYDVKEKKLSDKQKKIQPDIVLQKKGVDYLILDTKYEKSPPSPSDSDFYQATIYSLAKKCDTILLLPEYEREVSDAYRIKKEFTSTTDLKIHIKTIKFEDEEDFIEKMESKILRVVNSVRQISFSRKIGSK